MGFSKEIYYGYIIKGDLPGVIGYMKEFPEQEALYERFLAVFEREHYAVYETDSGINEILTIYQRYYRDVFYLCLGKKEAAGRLRARLADFLDIKSESPFQTIDWMPAEAGRRYKDESIELCDIEQNQITKVFRDKGFQFLGGRTSGYYGPYVWQTTEERTYEVELPDGIQSYSVKLLDGFLMKSWVDYLSFGEIGTGGWTDGDGIINCIKSAYDFDSEDFKVSLLKHEAQHARDLAVNKEMSSEALEYRAKLVELIYSSERNLLVQFAREADGTDRSNGHAAAAGRIVEGIARKIGMTSEEPEEMEKLSIGQIQDVARVLFEESKEMYFREF